MYAIYTDYNEVVTSIVYPPITKKQKEKINLLRLGGLPDTYYTVAKFPCKPYLFPSQRTAEQVAKLIKASWVGKEDE